MLWMNAVYDDGMSATAVDLTAAMFIDGESEVRQHPRGGSEESCLLIGIRAASASLGATATRDEYDVVQDGHMQLQPTNWADSEQIQTDLEFDASPEQDITNTDFHSPGWASVNQDISPWNPLTGTRRVAYGTDWINPGNSFFKGSEFGGTCEGIGMLYFQSESEPVYPTIGGPVVRIRKSAAADITSDVWSAVIKEELDDDGLDTDAMYRLLMGTVTAEGAEDTTISGWRMSVGGADWIGGLGPGGMQTNKVRTWFLEDGIKPFRGDDEVTVQALGASAHKPDVELWFEQVSVGRQDGGSTALKGIGARNVGAGLLGKKKAAAKKPGGLGIFGF